MSRKFRLAVKRPIVLAAICAAIWAAALVVALAGYRCLEKKAPSPSQYDLSASARCIGITDYAYDSSGRLTQTTQYSYDGHYMPMNLAYPDLVEETADSFFLLPGASSVWRKRSETRYFYGEEGRLLRKEEYPASFLGGNPEHTVTYSYGEDGGYTVTCEVQGTPEYILTYDADGRLLSADLQEQLGHPYFCHYDENGNRIRITDDHNVLVEESVYDPARSARLTGRPYGSYYVVWLDYFNEDQKRVSSYWYVRGYRGILQEHTAEEIQQVSVPSYQAFYDGDRLVEAVCENEWVRTLQSNQSYSSSRYELFDYDASGRILWHYRIQFSNGLYAYRYLYDGDRLIRKVYYEIQGNWQHTLYDGTTVRFCRNESGDLSTITRYDVSGNILHGYQFDRADSTSPTVLRAVGGAGSMAEAWQRTGGIPDIRKTDKTTGNEEKLFEQTEASPENGSFAGETDTSHTPPIPETTYPVKKGDCLWRIAEETLGDGRRWTEIYDCNRDVVGANPSLIYEGTWIRIPDEE